ncbi:MAG: polysaccharide biosynthesis tyrosine autokinase [Phycisphaeraceae bacterium]|nr:polysaccharide biosynthesis tyrosine autokinase [Phycisphaeraceae bacterium]MCB9848716.1 polysaccharide biosynthesis tyrosine autokinase [Phycisphaeraceae bacterium]
MKLLRQHMWLLMASVVLGGFLGIVTHFVLLRFAPAWTSEATFEFTGLMTSSEQQKSGVGSANQAEMEMFMATQTQKMLSRPILFAAVQDSRVKTDASSWSKQFIINGTYDPEEALIDLKEIVSARPIRDTNFGRLAVTTSDPVASAVICQAITRAYMNQVRTQYTVDSQDILEVLTQTLNAIQEERRLLEDQMDRIWTEADLPSLNPNTTFQQYTIDRLTTDLAQTRQDLEKLREQYDTYQSQLNNPGGVTFPEIVRQIVDEGPVVRGFKLQIAGLKAQLRTAADNLGQNHREVHRLEKQIAGVEAEREAQRQALMMETFNGLIENTQLEIASLEAAETDMVTQREKATVELADIERLKEQYDALEQDKDQLAVREQEVSAQLQDQRALKDRDAAQRVQVYAQALEPKEPSFPIIFVIVPVVTILVVMLVAGIVVLRELLEQRIRSASDAVLIPRLRVLSMIPDVSEDPAGVKAIETAIRDQPLGVVSESLRELRNTINKRMAARGHKTLLVATGMPDSGGTSIIANLAASFAAIEKRVLIIDSNFRRPRIHELMDVPNAPGLTDVLTGTVSLKDAIKPTNIAGVEVLASGSTDVTGYERLTTDAMSRTLEEASEQFDIVLVDSPPAIVSSDAINLANRCDAAVLVVRAYHEKRGLIARVCRNLDESNSELLGVVINAVRSSAGGYFKRNFQVAHDYNNPTATKGDKPAKKRKSKPPKGKKKDKAEREPEEVGAGHE